MRAGLITLVLLLVPTAAWAQGRNYLPQEAKRFKSITPYAKWIPFKWIKPLAKYKEVTVGQPHLKSYRKAFFPAKVFSRLRKTPSRSVRLKLKTDADVTKLRKALNLHKKDPKASAWVFDVVGTFHLPTGLISLALNTVSKLNKKQKLKSIQKARLSAWLAKGGEVVYSESLTPKSPWLLRRQLTYHVRVGTEAKVVLLWARVVPAEIN